MSEIRCPMCGKDNPKTLDHCQHCQARLTPLIMSPEDDNGLPDWMQDTGDEAAHQEPQTSPEESDPADWLNQLRGEEAADPFEAIPPEDEPAPGPEPEDDWLGRLSALSSEVSAPDEEGDAPEDTWLDGEIPEWMKLEEQDEPFSEEPAATAEDALPDWLAEPAASPEESPPPAEEGLPDWFLDTADAAPSEAAPSPEAPALSPEGDSELPAWMSETPDAEDDGIPDWISGVEDDDVEIPIILPDPQPEIPDWSANLEDDAPASSPSDEEPDWLEKLGAGEPGDFTPQGEELPAALLDDDAFKLDELTDLFARDTEDAPPEPGEIDDSLAPAELPGWLEAMRPVESTSEDQTSPADQGPTIQTGPLAGLSGVLMAEPEIARLKKAPTFSSKLNVSATQQQHVKLLRDLIASEGVPLQRTEPILVSSQGLLRWIIAFLLILAVGLAVITEGQFVPLPALESVPPQVMGASQLIETLAPQDPVLLAFDYEPGTAGEMSAAAAAVVDHIMLKGAYLTLVSTSPTGPALAENFFRTTQWAHNYTSGIQYINLGYIPGGASGLLGFAQIPQRITPLAFDGLEAWKTMPLSRISTLSDFEMVVIITDNPDIARTWIEQVQPALPSTPMIAVASAQAEPILRPYSGGQDPQLDGLVGGITGGAAYEQVTGKTHLARQYWDALNYGLLTAAAAILIGGLVNLVSIFLTKSGKGEAS